MEELRATSMMCQITDSLLPFQLFVICSTWISKDGRAVLWILLFLLCLHLGRCYPLILVYINLKCFSHTHNMGWCHEDNWNLNPGKLRNETFYVYICIAWSILLLECSVETLAEQLVGQGTWQPSPGDPRGEENAGIAQHVIEAE